MKSLAWICLLVCVSGVASSASITIESNRFSGENGIQLISEVTGDCPSDEYEDIMIEETITFESYTDGAVADDDRFTFRYAEVGTKESPLNLMVVNGTYNGVITGSVYTRIGYIEAGDPSGRLVMMLHGWPYVASEYVPLVREMMKIHPEYHYVVPYFPGVYPSDLLLNSDDDSINIDTFFFQKHVMFHLIKTIRPEYASGTDGPSDLVLVGEDWGVGMAENILITYKNELNSDTATLLHFNIPGNFASLLYIDNHGLTQPEPFKAYNSIKDWWYFRFNQGIISDQPLHYPDEIHSSEDQAVNLALHLERTTSFWKDTVGVETFDRMLLLMRDWNPRIVHSESYIRDMKTSWGHTYTGKRINSHSTRDVMSLDIGVLWYVSNGNTKMNNRTGAEDYINLNPPSATDIYLYAMLDPTTGTMTQMPAKYGSIRGEIDGNMGSTSYILPSDLSLFPNTVFNELVKKLGKSVHLSDPAFSAKKFKELLDA